jgi:hypothetical protein
MRAWVVFSIVRVLVFAVPLGVLLALRVEWWAAAAIAAAIGFCLSYIFLRPLRDQVATQLAEYRARGTAPTPASDEAAEDVD